MLCSAYLGNHSVLEPYNSEIVTLKHMYQYLSQNLPIYLHAYLHLLCLKHRRILDIDPTCFVTDERECLDQIRNTLDYVDDPDGLHELAKTYYQHSPELKSYFFRPYQSFRGSRLMIKQLVEFEGFFDDMACPELLYREEDGSTIAHALVDGFFIITITEMEALFDKYPQLLTICDNRGNLPSAVEDFTYHEVINAYIENRGIDVSEKSYGVAQASPYEKPAKQRRIDYYFKRK